MILFFDTETNGLPKNWGAKKNDTSNWPRVVQLAFSVYTHSGEKFFSYKSIIRPDGWEINKDTSAVHGITTEIAKENGLFAKDVLKIFIENYEKCDTLVAHNIAFDYPTLGCELIRYKINPKNRIEKHICTMIESTDFCSLPGGRFGQFKWPKLSELHLKLFNEDFEGAHDAMVDVDACAKCFFELKKIGVIK